MDTLSEHPMGDEGSVSRWWLRILGVVMVVGFGLLFVITGLAYRYAPPIPDRVVDAQGSTLFTGEDVRGGQEVFLPYGLMDNGSIWGHGAYLGPDYSALALHRMGEDTARAIAQARHGRPPEQLDEMDLAALQAETAVVMKTNRYDPATRVLQFTAPQAQALRRQVGYWTDYFTDPARNGGLRPDLITDPAELRQFSAFVAWAAWASVARRPGASYSYTNNFPYDPTVGNVPAPGAILWSALSLVVVLGGIAAVLLIVGRYEHLGWVSEHHVHPQLLPGTSGPGQRALVKYFVLVAVLFLAQSLIGAGVAHSRAQPGSFYGVPLDRILPSNLLRTWHLQTAIFWIATAYVAAALFLGRTLRQDEPRWFKPMVDVIFVAFAVVIFGSLLGQWLGLSKLLGDLWFWWGHQGWEFLELGRIWQFLLVIGLFAWFALLWALARPRNVKPQARPLAAMLLAAALAIPVFYVPALFYGARTNFTIVDTWRFWIIHLWVEGFFELFATTVVALTFYQLGLARRNTALRVIYLDAILYFIGGLVGTGHHWYFNGQTQINLALAGMFSVLEVVPLTLLTLDAWGFIGATRAECEQCGRAVNIPHKWTFYFQPASRR